MKTYTGFWPTHPSPKNNTKPSVGWLVELYLRLNSVCLTLTPVWPWHVGLYYFLFTLHWMELYRRPWHVGQFWETGPWVANWVEFRLWGRGDMSANAHRPPPVRDTEPGSTTWSQLPLTLTVTTTTTSPPPHRPLPTPPQPVHLPSRNYNPCCAERNKIKKKCADFHKFCMVIHGS